jgi:Flp pilus assembly protein TadG
MMYSQPRSSQQPVRYRPAWLRGGNRTAAAVVEFAFVAPVLFLFILALFEFGRALMVCELLTESARVGCRQAIIGGTSSAQIQQTVTSYLASVGINGDSVGVSVNNAALNSVEAANQPAYTDMTVQVTVPIRCVTWVPNPLFLNNGLLSGQFTMRRE